MWVPVLEYAPTIEKDLMEWASEPKEEDVISASSFEALSSDDTINSSIFLMAHASSMMRRTAELVTPFLPLHFGLH
jgi:hypothetical protein